VRVALDVTPRFGARTGIGRFVDELTAALARNETDIDLRGYVLSRRAPSDDDITRLPLPAGVALRWWSWSGWPRFDAVLGRPDLVHGTNFVAPPSRAVTVLTVHDCFLFRHPEQCRPAVRALAGPVRRAVARGAWVHAVSEFTGREVRELLRTDRVFVIPSGVTAMAPAGPMPHGVPQPFALTVATHEPRKRLLALARTFAADVAPATGATLVIVGGEGPDTPALRALAATTPSIRLLGYVDEPTRAALLARAAVYVQASAYEGFGLPILEAMHAGTPVVAVAADAVAEVSGDAARLAPVGDDGALAKEIITVLTGDGAVRESLRARGMARAAEFSWDACARDMAACYRSLL